MGRKRKKNESKSENTAALGLGIAALAVGGLFLMAGGSEDSKDKILEDVNQSPAKDWSKVSIDPDKVPELDQAHLPNHGVMLAPNGQAIVPNVNDQGTQGSLEWNAARTYEERFIDKWKIPKTYNAKDFTALIKNGATGVFKFPLVNKVRLNPVTADLYGDIEARRFTILIESMDDLEHLEVFLACLMIATFNPTQGAPDATAIDGVKQMFECFGYHRFVLPENTATFQTMLGLSRILPRSEQAWVMASRMDAAGQRVDDESIKRYIRNGWGWGIPSECIPYFREGFFNESTFGRDENKPTGKRFAELSEQEAQAVNAAFLDGNMLILERAAIRFSNVVMMLCAGGSVSSAQNILGRVGTTLLALGAGTAGAFAGDFKGLIAGATEGIKLLIDLFASADKAEQNNKAAQNMIDAHILRVMEKMNRSHTQFLGYRLRTEANWSGFRIGPSRTLARYLRNFVLQRDGLFAGCGAVLYPQISMFLRMPKFGVIAYAGNQDNFGVVLRYDSTAKHTGLYPIGWVPFKITHADQMVEFIDYTEPKSVRLDEFDLGVKSLKFGK